MSVLFLWLEVQSANEQAMLRTSEKFITKAGGQKLSGDVESKQPHALQPPNLISCSEALPAVWLLSSETAGLEQTALTQRSAGQDKVT